MNHLPDYFADFALNYAKAMTGGDEFSVLAQHDGDSIVVVRLDEEQLDVYWDIEGDYYGERDKSDDPLLLEDLANYWSDDYLAPSPEIYRLSRHENGFCVSGDMGRLPLWLTYFADYYNIALNAIGDLPRREL